MRLRIVLGNLGTIVRLTAAALALPAVVALIFESQVPGTDVAGYNVPSNALVFLSVAFFSLALGLFMERFAGAEEFREAEGFVLVALGYLVVSAVGALPFLLSGAIPDPVDAYFESVSGFTTTGATVMAYPLEQHAPSVMFWRSLTQWLGGMGIIVLGVALLPKLVESGASMMRAEFSGGGVRLRPKLAQTARVFWVIYLVMTLLGAGALAAVFWSSGMSPDLAVFEGLTHAFTSIATSGFSTRTDSIGAFDDPLVELILVVLMVTGAVSFVLHYRAIHGEGARAYRDEELLFMLTLLAGVTAACAGILYFFGSPAAWASLGGAPDPVMALRAALFNVTSVLTTTGYASANYDAWPDAARILLIVMLFTGGMVGSTAGGIKAMRILALAKLLRREAMRILYPRAVLSVRIRGATLDDAALHTIGAFFFAFVTVVLVSTILLTFTGLDMVASFTSAAASVTTLGPAMGPVVGGPGFTYAEVHPAGKVVLLLGMWFGRLEVFAALILLLPTTYRR